MIVGGEAKGQHRSETRSEVATAGGKRVQASVAEEQGHVWEGRWEWAQPAQGQGSVVRSDLHVSSWSPAQCLSRGMA